MPKPLEDCLFQIREYVGQLEPGLVTAGHAVELLEYAVEVIRVGEALKLAVAERATDAFVWRQEGFRSGAEWLATKTGESTGQALAALETAEALKELPGTADALRRGDISGAQVREIAAAAKVNPDAEGELLEVANRHTLKGLKRRCGRIKAQEHYGLDEVARYRAIKATRFHRHWTDADGALRGTYKLTPDDGALWLQSLQAEADRLFDQSRAAGVRESPECIHADALIALARRTAQADDNGPAPAPARITLRVDADSLCRGRVEGDEVCEIPGVGPVPLATARALLNDADISVVVRRGVDVVSVCHRGRNVRRHLRSALEERDPICVVPGCDVSHGLEIDHYKVPYASNGPTELWNLARLCRWHHMLKTYDGYVLAGGPGAWEWLAPSGGDRAGPGWDPPEPVPLKSEPLGPATEAELQAFRAASRGRSAPPPPGTEPWGSWFAEPVHF